ncbi:hypothetical protein CVT25_011547, partial [Psilocybe cyanescens]
MLGSSTRGLRPVQKRVLYHACVLPIVTYGFRLWYFAAARCKGALHHLSTMQRSAALWITGAFRTSPTGGTMSEPEIFRTSGTLFESDTKVLALTETLLPMNPLSRPGVRLMDRFADQVHFDDCKISRGDADKELKQRTKHLDKLRDKISENIGIYYAGTDASLPLSGRYQAIAASILFSGGGHSVAVCESLQTWFTRKDGQSITFPGGKDNPWVHFANMSSPQLYARMWRCTLNHAPVGSYYSRFNLNDGETSC